MTDDDLFAVSEAMALLVPEDPAPARRRAGLFPAGARGPAWIQAMRGPFPQVRYVATGGITPQTAPAYLAAGASVVAMGAALTDAHRLALVRRLIAGAPKGRHRHEDHPCGDVPHPTTVTVPAHRHRHWARRLG